MIGLRRSIIDLRWWLARSKSGAVSFDLLEFVQQVWCVPGGGVRALFRPENVYPKANPARLRAQSISRNCSAIDCFCCNILIAPVLCSAIVGMAGVCDRGDNCAATVWSRADLRQALRAVHPRRHRG